MSSEKLPSFRKPPVIETVLGVQFPPIDGWGIVHFGLLAQQWRDRFTSTETHPRLAQSFESFGTLQSQSEPDIHVLTGQNVADHIRFWLVSADSHEVIQVQSDRFIYNWRKGDSDAEYPRYESFVLPQFQRWWTAFTAFLDEQRLPTPKVNQCEVTYVNHIFEGHGWNPPGNWHEIFSYMQESGSKFLPRPESQSDNLNFAFLEHDGRLRVNISTAVRNRDGRRVIVMQLTAKGKPKSSEQADIVRWFNVGREWIVRGFADLTTPRMHQIWEREI